MNLQTQSKQIVPFPSWNDFGLQNKNRNLIDRDSKFLFHYEDSDYEELKYFPTDEYENSLNTEEESPYEKYSQEPKSKRRRIKTNKYRKKRPKKEDTETEPEKKYIGQPDNNRNRKKRKRKKKKNSGRRESNADWPMVSVMHSMLDFLSNPGDYFSNLQSSYAGGEGDASFGEGGEYNGGGGGGSGYSGGGGGASASNAAAPGILDGLNGIIGDTTLSRKV
jgi:hypothetical protein